MQISAKIKVDTNGFEFYYSKGKMWFVRVSTNIKKEHTNVHKHKFVLTGSL